MDAGDRERARDELTAALGARDAYPFERGAAHVETYYDLVGVLMGVELALGDLSACASRGLEATNAYYRSPFVMVRNTPTGNGLERIRQDCTSRWEKKYTRDPQERCSDAALRAGARCYTYSPGQVVSDGAELGADERRERKLGPTLSSTSNTGGVTTFTFADGFLGAPVHCGGELVGAWTDGGTTYLRIKGAFRYCWPGTAAWEVDAVYRTEGGRAVLVDEIVATYH
ncbi:MAG: hypothetical protein RIF41_27465 [Polyangiaceae bacterium]